MHTRSRKQTNHTNEVNKYKQKTRKKTITRKEATAAPPTRPLPTYVLVVHVLEHAQLPVGALGVDVRLEGPRQLLDGHLPPRLRVHGRAGGERRSVKS